MTSPTENGRDRWGSKLGFVLAASGSAIGLGNIVFFGARAYEYGAGAFYLPYLLALFIVGIPVMIAEMGLGSLSQHAFPTSLGRIGGRWGEFAGWWAVLNAGWITLYYVAILAWVCGMLLGSFGRLWQDATALPQFDAASMANPEGFFFAMLSSGWVLLLVLAVWAANYWLARSGARSIESAVKVFVPLMWLFMLLLIVRGLTLPHGKEGIYLLFTPDFEVMRDVEVWRGAVSQIFFSLTLGFGVMTAYASYLPRDADQVNNGLVTACLNCAFEFVAGVAIFTLLFTFAIVPQASTIAMMFFVMPRGLDAMPTGTVAIGLLFFVLLLLAGLSSSVSLVETIVRSLMDKFGGTRKALLRLVCLVGVVGSSAFAWPLVVDRPLAGNGTLGLSLLDLVDHWAFSHGLLIVGLVECLILGWVLPASRLREHLNAHSRLHLPLAFEWLIKWIIPLLLTGLLLMAVRDKWIGGLYGVGGGYDGGFFVLPWVAFLLWLVGTTAAAAWLTLRSAHPSTEAATRETLR